MSFDILFRDTATGATGYFVSTAGEGLSSWYGLGGTSTASAIIGSPAFG